MELGYEVELAAVGLVAHPLDNAAVAKMALEPGTTVRLPGGSARLARGVLLGHRFCVAAVRRGERLRSWNAGFGTALRDIEPGEPLYNAKAIAALAQRSGVTGLPREPNFADWCEPFRAEAGAMELGRGNVQPGKVAAGDIFQGLPREGGRGAGTRNFVVVFACCNEAAFLAEGAAEALRAQIGPQHAVDGVVPAVHTESGAGNNAELVRRAMAGLVVHPNVAGALVVSREGDALTAAELETYMKTDHRLASRLAATPNLFLTLASGSSVAEDVAAVTAAATRDLLPLALAPGNCERRALPVANLNVALQCGGSDAFSGLTANPLVGAVARELVHRGGSAVLAETDELIGAEAYVLRRVRSLEVADKFLDMIRRITQLLAWHGVSAEGNPSGGNLLRGLYNIAIKSLGAATKKPDDVQLDDVLDYAELAQRAGYLFMHSPGNDLESVAGQVASGCNVVFFTTGNGSVTNFPFVPTIKVVSTTARFEFLRKDMDFNAGAIADHPEVPLQEHTDRLLRLLLQVASGERTAGEAAGHSQVSLWRDWRHSNSDELAAYCRDAAQPLAAPPGLDARAAKLASAVQLCAPRWPRTGVVLPTSLCSSEVAKLVAARATQSAQLGGSFVALPHSEGCGSNYGSAAFGLEHELPEHAGVDLLDRVMIGHVRHPLVSRVVMLEHGCEINHNDRMTRQMKAADTPMQHVAMASVQGDGGVQASLDRCLERLAHVPERARPSGRVCIGLACAEADDAFGVELLHLVGHALAHAGASVVAFGAPPSLRFAERAGDGLQLMESLSTDWTERLTGLASAGAEVIIGWGCSRPLAGHPFVPLLQVGDSGAGRLCDVAVPRAAGHDPAARAVLAALAALLAHETDAPPTLALRTKHTAFQLARGPLGVSV